MRRHDDRRGAAARALVLGAAALLAAGCGGRSEAGASGDGPAAARDGGAPDGRPDGRARDLEPDAPPVLPWVSTYAGTSCNVAWHDGPRLQTPIGPVIDLALDPASGDLYFTNRQLVQAIRNDQVVTVAGGYSSQLVGPALQVMIVNAMALTFGPDGSIYIADGTYIRRIYQGQVTAVAGKFDAPGYVDGPADTARFDEILDIVVDDAGDLLVGELGHIRRVHAGVVSTLAGTLAHSGMPREDGPAASVAFRLVPALLPEADGLLFNEGCRLRRLAGGQVTTLGGQLSSCEPVDGVVEKAYFGSIGSIVRTGQTLYFTDGFKNGSLLRRIDGGSVTSLNALGKGLRNGPLAQALFSGKLSLVVDARGDLFVSELGNCVIRRVQMH